MVHFAARNAGRKIHPMEARKDLAHVLQVYRHWRRQRRIAQGLEKGILAALWDDLASFLAKGGHAWYSVRRAIEISKPFAAWAKSIGIRNARGISEELVGRYLLSGRCPRDGPRFLRLLMVFLRARGIVPSRKPASRLSMTPAIVKEYLQFLRDHKGTGVRTAEQHRRHIESLLEALGTRTAKGLRHLDGAELQRFIIERASGLSRAGRKSLCAAIRSFLRFLYLRGYTAVDLVSAVPVIPSFKLDRLPTAISTDAIEQILAVIDRSSPVGRRNYAMLLILATYGIRAGQLCALQLEDIFWRRGVLRIPGAKSGKEVFLPLQSAVGEAVVDYLKRGRPVGWPFRQVFLRVRAPIGPLKGGLANVIRTYARKAGVDIPSFGSHAWRHACASPYTSTRRDEFF